MGAAVSIASTLNPDSVRLLDRSSCLAKLMPVRCTTTPGIDLAGKRRRPTSLKSGKLRQGMTEKGQTGAVA
jgi:hypothetical protein